MSPLFLAMCLMVAGVYEANSAEVTDLSITPGLCRSLTVEQICATKWGFDRRQVTTSMRWKVLQLYKDKHCRKFEIDHICPRELGGADDVTNLWKQCYPDARLKDRVENRLHKEVCA